MASNCPILQMKRLARFVIKVLQLVRTDVLTPLLFLLPYKRQYSKTVAKTITIIKYLNF